MSQVSPDNDTQLDSFLVAETDDVAPDTGSNTDTVISEQKNVSEELQGKRVDQVAAILFPDYSREVLKGWIARGDILVDGKVAKAKTRLKGGELIELNTTLVAHSEDLPEDIPLDIIYEDEDVLVINKPAGLVVHPGAGNWTGTLVNALLFHDASLKSLPRAGLVHRIDKDTTGLLVVAKNSVAQQHLINQLKDKTVYRHYQALVVGEMLGELSAGGTIDAPIKRHPKDRKKMSVQDDGKSAISHFTVEDNYKGYTLVSVQLETGRTHQIRVHMTHLGFPLVGDPVYGNRKQLSAQVDEQVKSAVLAFNRQALHAYELGFIHPKTNEDMLLSAPLPKDMTDLIETLKQYS